MLYYPDRFAYCNPLSKVHPAEKLFFAIATMVICLAAQSMVLWLAVVVLMTGVSVFLAKVPCKVFLKLMLVPAAFLMVGTITVAISIGSDTDNLLWGWRYFNIVLGVSTQSIQLALELLLRALSAVTCLLFLAMTTPQIEIIATLRKLKFPELFLDLMSLVYRFLFVLMDLAEKTYHAQNVRMGYASIRLGYLSFGQMITNLLFNSYRRSLELYSALEARGYNGKLIVLEREYSLSKVNLVLICIIEICLIGIGWW